MLAWKQSSYSQRYRQRSHKSLIGSWIQNATENGTHFIAACEIAVDLMDNLIEPIN